MTGRLRRLDLAHGADCPLVACATFQAGDAIGATPEGVARYLDLLIGAPE